MKHSWGIIALLLLLAGCAPATPQQTYLTQYRERFHGPDENGVRLAHLICDDLTAGRSFTAEAAYLQSLNMGVTEADAAYLIGASTAAYCPEFINH